MKEEVNRKRSLSSGSGRGNKPGTDRMPVGLSLVLEGWRKCGPP